MGKAEIQAILTTIVLISDHRLTHILLYVKIPRNMNQEKSIRFFSSYYFYGTENQHAVGGA
jgi:hypothetical protein